MNKSEKLILVDVDGVLLDWSYGFNNWMEKKGFKLIDSSEFNINYRYHVDNGADLVVQFNESVHMKKLAPLRDAIKYVKKLHEEHGYVFQVISSISKDDYVQALRTEHLSEMFSESVFESFTYLDVGQDKYDVLQEYRDTECWWIEDQPGNAEIGNRLGLKAVLMDHEYNKSSDIHRVNNWKEIYDLITGEAIY